MDLISLKTFKVVAETGAVSRAADQLHCVQSNVTTRIKGLEAELGAPLFYRGSRGVTLTPTGSTLLHYAERILRLVNEATLVIKEAGGEPASIRIGAMETTAAIRLPPVLTTFSRRFPKVDVALRTGPTAALVEDILAHRLDVALVCGPINHPDIVAEPAFTEELVLVRSPVLPADRREVLLVFRSGCSYRARAEEWLRHSGWAAPQMLELGTLDGILGCVASGMGVTLMPRAVVEGSRLRESLDIAPLPKPFRAAETLLIRHRDALLTATLRALIALIEGGAGARMLDNVRPAQPAGRERRTRSA